MSGLLRRSARAVLALVLCAALLMPALFVACESHHTCSGDACPVCHALHIAEQALSQAGTLPGTPVPQPNVPLMAALAAGAACARHRHVTLVELRTRLDL